MTMLHVALRDGFRGHTVQVRIDGEEVYQRDGVTTDLTISRADGFETQTDGGHLGIEVTAEPGPVRGSTVINTADHTYLTISLEGNAVRFQPSSEPFRFM